MKMENLMKSKRHLLREMLAYKVVSVVGLFVLICVTLDHEHNEVRIFQTKVIVLLTNLC